MHRSLGKLYCDGELIWSGEFDIAIAESEYPSGWSAVARVDDSSLRFSLLARSERCRLVLADGRSGDLFPDHIDTPKDASIAFRGTGSLE